MLIAPGELTVKNGQTYSWQNTGTPPTGKGAQVGEYIGGAVYRAYAPRTPDDGIRYFVAVWSEEGNLHFNTIKIKIPKTYKIAPEDLVEIPDKPWTWKTSVFLRDEPRRPDRLSPVEPKNGLGPFPGEHEVPGAHE
jgi:hypothetical protein